VPDVAGRRILVVTYYYPPSTASGASRWAAMVRHFRALGHEVWVVTSASTGVLPDDRQHGVVRATDLVTSGPLRRMLHRPALARPGAAPTDVPAPAVLTRVLVPDAHVLSWVPWAARAARALVARERIECLITSGPPDSTHLVALALGRRRPAWIADFRDGWTFQPLGASWPTAVQRRLDAGLERVVAQRAELTIGATRPIAEDLAGRLGSTSHWVSNGWDPELEGDVAAAPEIDFGGGADWVTLVHTGTLSGAGGVGPRGRDPRPLLAALRVLNSRASPGGRRVRLVLAGRPTADDEKLLSAAALGEAVLHVGLLSRVAAVSLQRQADGLLLMTGNDSSEATGKLFEYLASGRPLIALARDNEAARIVEATGTGVVVAPDDEAAITAALEALLDGTLARAYAPRELDRFTYPGLARIALELVEQAVAARGRR
jgi:glycosyltransferase involved in cell wall biosynthesis